MIKLNTPLKTSDIRKLRMGDKVLLSGVIFTARDRAYEYFSKNDFPKIKGGVLYNCGPLVDGRKIIAAGPTTSIRLSIYSDILKKYDIKAVIGKAGMDENTLKIMKGKCVYFSAVGGASLIYANCIKKVNNVYKKEFGTTEAIWELEVKDFPVIVTMDSHGGDLHQQVYEKSKKHLSMSK